MKGAVAIVNARLRAAGRAEVVIRARGYYRLSGGESHNFYEIGLYSIGSALKGPEYADHMTGAVENIFEQNGIKLALGRSS